MKSTAYKKLWKDLTNLQSNTDTWAFKDYVLITLFYKFISTKIINYMTNKKIDYLNLSNEQSYMYKQELVERFGFYISPDNLFQSVTKNLIHDKYLNIILKRKFSEIEEQSTSKIKNIFSDFNETSNILGNSDYNRSKKISELIAIIEKVDTSESQLFSNIYENLLNDYANSAKHDEGSYYTPSCIGELLSRIILEKNPNINSVYDPTCGSGNLLVAFNKLIGPNQNIKIYGNELSASAIAICRMNMIINELKNFKLSQNDTLKVSKPFMDTNSFDTIISNPPFHTSWDPELVESNDSRFKDLPVLPPKKIADYAFIFDSISKLVEKGIAGIVISPSILTRGKEEKELRKCLIEKNLVDTIILLPSGLFIGTKIPVAIMIINKNKKDNNVLLIDASKEITKKENTKILSNENIEHILELIKKRTTIKGKSYLASELDIENKSYELDVRKYILDKDISLNKMIDRPVVSLEEVVTQISDIVKQIKNEETIIEDLTKENTHELAELNTLAHSIKQGLNPRHFFTLNKTGEYSYLSSKEIVDHKVITNKYTPKVDKKAKERINNYSKLEIGDILFTLADNEVKVALVESDEYDISEAFYSIKPKLDKIEPTYLIYLLESNIVREQLNEILTSGNYGKVTITNFRKILIPIVELEKQKTITNHLDRLYQLKNKLKNESVNKFV